MSDPNRKVRLGVIGVGQIGKAHLNNYSKINAAEVVAIADINEAEAQAVSERFGIPNVFTDFHKLLERDDIEAVDVCMHNNLHRAATVAGLEAGKHVYCEKPLAGSYIDAEAMLQAARDTGKMLAMQLSTLYSKEVRAAKELIEAGRLGKVYHARSTGFRRRGRPFVDGYGSPTFVQKEISAGGALYDMGVYHIASMLYLLGNPPVQTISGKVYQETDMDPDRRRISGYNVEELGLGFVRFAGNLSLDIIESWAIHLDRFESSVVVGSQGGVRLEPFSYFFNDGDLEFDATGNLDGFAWRKNTVHGNGDAYNSSQEHWTAALQGRVPLLPTAELGLATMLISEGIYQSEKLGREVTAEEVRSLSKSTMIAI
jgi:predicted dehydrogenase